MSKFDNIMSSASSGFPMIDRVISKDLNSRTGDCIIKSTPGTKWTEKIISPFANILKIVIQGGFLENFFCSHNLKIIFSRHNSRKFYLEQPCLII